MAIGPGGTMLELFTALWKDETGQDLAETIFDNIRGELEAAPGGSGGS
jgi:hypothetical protein